MKNEQQQALEAVIGTMEDFEGEDPERSLDLEFGNVDIKFKHLPAILSALQTAPCVDSINSEYEDNTSPYTEGGQCVDVERKVLGDELNGGLLRGLCFTVWNIAKKPNEEDGKDSDWCNDTLPVVQSTIKLLRGLIFEQGHLRPAEQWQDIEEWSEDYNDCLFVFFKDTGGQYEYYDCLFTSPICSDFPDMEALKLWGKFQRISITKEDFSLPTPPKRNDDG